MTINNVFHCTGQVEEFLKTGDYATTLREITQEFECNRGEVYLAAWALTSSLCKHRFGCAYACVCVCLDACVYICVCAL